MSQPKPIHPVIQNALKNGIAFPHVVGEKAPEHKPTPAPGTAGRVGSRQPGQPQ